MTTKYRPFLRWAGSKQKLLPILSEYWDSSFNRYIEPFMGSAALFLHIKPERAVLSDINKDLVDTFNIVKKQADELYELVLSYPINKDFYYNLRAVDTSNLSKLETAARFIYLNRYCYNGLYRTNKSGRFNVPFAAYKNGALPSIDCFKYWAELLNKAEIVCGDFYDTIKQASRGDLVYLDPPYAIKNSRIFYQYDPNTFGLEDMTKLATALDVIDNNGARFVLSYANSPEMSDIIRNWKYVVVSTRRNIAGFSGNRRMAEEIIVTNI